MRRGWRSTTHSPWREGPPAPQLAPSNALFSPPHQTLTARLLLVRAAPGLPAAPLATRLFPLCLPMRTERETRGREREWEGQMKALERKFYMNSLSTHNTPFRRSHKRPHLFPILGQPVRPAHARRGREQGLDRSQFQDFNTGAGRRDPARQIHERTAKSSPLSGRRWRGVHRRRWHLVGCDWRLWSARGRGRRYLRQGRHQVDRRLT